MIKQTWILDLVGEDKLLEIDLEKTLFNLGLHRQLNIVVIFFFFAFPLPSPCPASGYTRWTMGKRE